jgi:hypothetical protein
MMFVPVLPVYMYGVLRTGRLLYFTAVNPSIYMGGFFGEQKDDILHLIPEKYKAKSLLITSKLTEREAQTVLSQQNINLPVVLKPNVGERGNGVCIVNSCTEISNYFAHYGEFLIQEYIDYPLELGVLYSRAANEEKGAVSSITEKAFLSVVGDGQSTVLDLLDQDSRGRIYVDLIRNSYPEQVNIIPPKNEKHIVHKIGNHCKGTRFINANKHISEELNEVFTDISNQISGFHYGRFDLKVPSYEHLLSGRDLKIFELNGVSSEPGHVYDYPHVLKAYWNIGKHWIRIVKIARVNIKKGVETTPLSLFLAQINKHFFSKP